ncbi:hypothetical protein C0213_08250 [Latilactobacillus sakei]|nr:hypothetical protein [Latilactobacillus sakei]AUX12410.1 hypothetical protein C0213_08250 [Latilactobacillus sakei]
MLSQTETLSSVTYIMRCNQIIEKLLVFDTVFNEYTQTCRNIILGRCLVNENLHSLKKYFQKNLVKLMHFVQLVESINPPSYFTDTNQRLKEAFRGYVESVEKMLLIIDSEDDSVILEKIQEIRRIQKDYCHKINEALADVVKLG